MFSSYFYQFSFCLLVKQYLPITTNKMPPSTITDETVPHPQMVRVHRRLNSLLKRIEIPDYLNSGIKGRSHIKNGKII